VSDTVDSRADAAPGTAAPGSFSRSASGLIRVAGSWDVFIFNIGLVSIGIAIAYNQYFGPSLYPGAAVWLSTLLATLGMLMVGTAFYLWSTIFPRSGGIYVFLSRSTHPSLAFVLTVVETLILLYYGALAAGLIVTVGLASFFATVGSVTDNGTLLDWAGSISGKAGVFWIGSTVLVIAGLLLASGTRRYFTVQKVLFLISSVGLVVLFAVMLFGSRNSFAANLSSLANLDYNQVISAATENGYLNQDFSFTKTVEFLVWPLLPLLGGVQSVGIAGEIKKVRRAQLLGMLGALIVSGIVIAVFALLSNKVFGATFQGAIGFNSLTGDVAHSTEGTMGAVPYFTVLAGILVDNAVLAVIIMATFVALIWFWVPAELAYATRTMIAWSFDRVAPDKLGYVSRRFNTPVVAIALSTAGAIFFMWLISYKAISLLTLVEALVIVWGIVLLSAIVFPWTKKSFYDRSPASAWKIGKIPVISITGALGLAFFVLVFVLLWRDENAAGPLVDAGSTGFWIVVGAIGAATIWYVANRAYRRSKGVDIDLAFRQIPIE
jgi:APA family basic amino acid/polyamine antiporter